MLIASIVGFTKKTYIRAEAQAGHWPKSQTENDISLCINLLHIKILSTTDCKHPCWLQDKFYTVGMCCATCTHVCAKQCPLGELVVHQCRRKCSLLVSCKAMCGSGKKDVRGSARAATQCCHCHLSFPCSDYSWLQMTCFGSVKPWVYKQSSLGQRSDFPGELWQDAHTKTSCDIIKQFSC